MKVRNINPHDEGVWIAATDQDVPAGGTVDVDDDLGVTLCEQVDNWAPGDPGSAAFFAAFCALVAGEPAKTETKKERDARLAAEATEVADKVGA